MILHAFQIRPRPGIKRRGNSEPIAMPTNAQSAADVLIAAISAMRNSDKLKNAQLINNADSAGAVADIFELAVAAVDAFGQRLAYEAGLDGDRFTPGLLASAEMDDFKYHCEQAAEMANASRFVDLRPVCGTLCKPLQGV